MVKKNEHIHPGHNLTGIVIAAAAAVITLAIYMALLLTTEGSPLLLGIIVTVLYALGIAVWQLVMILRRRRTSAEGASLSPVLGNIMLDMVQKMPSPVIICDEATDRIIWQNRAVASLLPDQKTLLGKTLTSTLQFSAAEVMTLENTEEKTVAVSNRFFRVKGYRIHSAERTFFLLFFAEITELEALKKDIDDQNLVVGYVMIDNVDQMLQYEQDRYRATASRIDGILRDWVAEANGILKEYDRDR